MFKKFFNAVTVCFAFGASPAFSLEYTVLPNPQGDGPSLLVEGKFERGDDINRFRQVLDRYNPVTVQLQSPGGNILSAVEHGREIRKRALNTYVPKGGVCASACSLTFMGGVIRLAAEGTIGVHQAAFYPDNTLGADDKVKAVQFLTADIVAYMTEMGVSASLLALTLSAAPEEMHFLSLPEMVEHKVTNIAPIVVETQRRLLKQKEGAPAPVEQDRTVRTTTAPAATVEPVPRFVPTRTSRYPLPVPKVLPRAGTIFIPTLADDIPATRVQPPDPHLPMLSKAELEANGRKRLIDYVEAMQGGPRGRRFIAANTANELSYIKSDQRVSRSFIVSEFRKEAENTPKRYHAIFPDTLTVECEDAGCVARAEFGSLLVGKTGQKATVHGGLILGWHPAGQISSLWVGTKSVKRLTGQQSYLSDAMFRSGKSCDFSSRLKMRSDLCEYNERLSARLRSDGWTIKGGGEWSNWIAPRTVARRQLPKHLSDPDQIFIRENRQLNNMEDR